MYAAEGPMAKISRTRDCDLRGRRELCVAVPHDDFASTCQNLQGFRLQGNDGIDVSLHEGKY